MKMFSFFVQDIQQKQRLDQFLAAQSTLDLSRAHIQRLIKEGSVFVDKSIITQPKFLIKAGMLIEVVKKESETCSLEAVAMALNILYEDEDILVLNKAPGIVVHPGNGTYEPTLVHGLLHHCGKSLSGIGGIKRPGIVHRLDKDTSGVMVIAKHDLAHRHLSEQFFDHGKAGILKRSYKAFVWGRPSPAIGTITTFLGRSKYDRIKRAIVSQEAKDAKKAITHYEVKSSFYDKKCHYVKEKRDSTKIAIASLIDCYLETGRTHQIRVHMAHKRHSLLGDAVYGNEQKSKINLLPPFLIDILNSFNRQALHAYFLRFMHPMKGKVLEFETDLPEDFSFLYQAFLNAFEEEK